MVTHRARTKVACAIACCAPVGGASSASGGDVPTRIAVRITTTIPIVSSTRALVRSVGIVSGLVRRGFTTRQL